MQSFEQQLRKIEKRLDRAAGFGEINKKEFRRANRNAGREIVVATRSNLKPYKEDITIHFEDRDNIVVKRDQLRKSIGVWFPKSSNTAFIGPRANTAGKRPLKRKVRDNADGWFAHIVDMGARPGQMRKGGKPGSGTIINTPMKGKISQGLQVGQAKARQKQLELYRKEFNRYMR